MISFITQYGIYAMIIIVFLEYACFPVSSEIVLPLSGAAAAAAGMGFIPVTIVCSIAGLAGTYLIYIISLYLGNKLMKKAAIKNLSPYKKKKIINFNPETLAKCTAFIEKRGKYAVCISRIIPLFRTYIAFAAGLAQMPRHEYLTWSFLGIITWNSVLIACGYILGNNWSIVISYYKNYKYILLICILFPVLTYIAYRIIKFKAKTKTD
ncbi:MAG: DedA family protein [Lachnospiraceae bacterium]